MSTFIETADIKTNREKVVQRCEMENCANFADYFIPIEHKGKPLYYCGSCRNTFPRYTHRQFIKFYALEWILMLETEFCY